jgi:nucleoside-diphosphate-sugar epimerase
MNAKKVLLTGATGLIGKETIDPLLQFGYEVFALSSRKQIGNEKVKWLYADLLDYGSIEKAICEIKPLYLLHFAWYTGEGYLSADVNYQLKDASLNLLEAFKKNGGQRAIFAGTCFEYDFKNTPLKETDALNPLTIYAQCKNELREHAELYAKKHDLSFGWGRIFYVLGHGEHENRLLPYIVKLLKNNEKVIIKSGPLIRDYMYTKDIAGAFVKFLDSDITGCVNICSGKGFSIKEFAFKIAEKMKKSLNSFEFVDDIANQTAVIVGDNTILLNEVKYQSKYNMDKALDNILYDII